MIHDLDKTKDNEIYIISSCRTIGEGIDTKNANHIVFVDPKSSSTDIIQNIGRGVRKTKITKRPTTITIPSFIDYERYRDTEHDNQEQKDQIVREGMYHYGDFSCVLNVLAAIQQDDEEYYQLCLLYPNKHFKSEIERNLKAQGKNMSSLGTNIENMFGVEREQKESDEQLLERVANQNGIRIELHTNDMNEEGENNIIYFGDEKNHVIHSIYKDDNQDSDNYYNITGNQNNSKSKPCKRRKINIKIKHDEEFKVLWNIEENGDQILDNRISSCILNFIISGTYPPGIGYIYVPAEPALAPAIAVCE
jgi:predicted helicase